MRIFRFCSFSNFKSFTVKPTVTQSVSQSVSPSLDRQRDDIRDDVQHSEHRQICCGPLCSLNIALCRPRRIQTGSQRVRGIKCYPGNPNINNRDQNEIAQRISTNHRQHCFCVIHHIQMILKYVRFQCDLAHPP